MTVTATYLDDLSRVRLEGSGLDVAASSAVVEYSTDLVQWAEVRGGDPVTVAGGAFVLDDYEFPVSALVTYRVTPDVGAVEEVTVTVDLDTHWFKSLTRPFLNMPFTLLDFDEVTTTARNGVFAIVGRSVPVAVTDVRSGLHINVLVLTETQAERTAMGLLLASGDPLFVHAPDGDGFDSMYVVVGDTTETRPTVRHTHARIFHLPCTEVAAPDLSIVGSTVTWQGIVNAFATWADVLAAEATWADLADRIGDPSDVIVG